MLKITQNPILRGVIAWLLVLFLGWTIITFAESTGFTDLLSVKKNNKLEAATWDDLINRLDELEAKLEKEAANRVPVWSVVAFTWACPSGWEWVDYTALNDWSYIMWAWKTENFWKKFHNCNRSATETWACNIYLNTSQLPSHAHYVLNTKRRWSNCAFDQNNCNGATLVAHRHYNDDESNDYYNLGWSYLDANAWMSSYVWENKPINIAGNFVFLHYCIKVR